MRLKLPDSKFEFHSGTSTREAYKPLVYIRFGNSNFEFDGEAADKLIPNDFH